MSLLHRVTLTHFDYRTIKIVDSRVQSLSKLGRTKYLFNRGRIDAEVMDLRIKVDNTQTAFNVYLLHLHLYRCS